MLSADTILFRIEEKGVISEMFKSKPFKLSLNGSQNIGEFIGIGHYGLSKGNDEKEVMIQNITLSKKTSRGRIKDFF